MIIPVKGIPIIVHSPPPPGKDGAGIVDAGDIASMLSALLVAFTVMIVFYWRLKKVLGT
jgi:uncharacterized membrane protein